MSTYLVVAAAAVAVLVAACAPFGSSDAVHTAPAAVAPASPPIVKTKLVTPGSSGMPSQIVIPSSVGEVTFLHQAHTEDRAIGCAECHHQINAKALNTPHPDYLQSSWINCKACHREQNRVKQGVYACSTCHPASPTNIADETLSAKVVIHKQCWNCHPVSTGKEASRSCETCHSGNKAL
ncbi:MAG: hypothetical protein A3I63_00595 [Betaproteobacteria bacterium RIFCSPLOWO2_02_FULL_66_14]|nr:MAG: hypothetical protein A3I63_00595 [Betaproteobacteria bacterium RIFCSPLOWO2_02_FULL_66_14]